MDLNSKIFSQVTEYLMLKKPLVFSVIPALQKEVWFPLMPVAMETPIKIKMVAGAAAQPQIKKKKKNGRMK